MTAATHRWLSVRRRRPAAQRIAWSIPITRGHAPNLRHAASDPETIETSLVRRRQDGSATSVPRGATIRRALSDIGRLPAFFGGGRAMRRPVIKI